MNAKIHASKPQVHASKATPMLAVLGGLALCFFCFAALVPVGTHTAYPAPDDGKDAYVKNCAECHGVKVAGIAATTKNARDKGPDLTGIGEKYQPKWLKRYVKEEADDGGKKHVKKFKGSDEELQVLVDWLLEQKAEDDDE